MQSGRNTLTTNWYRGIPGIYLLLLCDVVKRLGGNDQDIIDGLGVTRSGLLQPDSRISVLTGHIAAGRAVHSVGSKGLGLEYAQALKVTLHGPLGLMAMSSPTIADALDAVVRYIGLRAPFLQAGYRVDGEQSEIVVNPRADIGDLLTFIMEAILVGFVLMLEQLLGEKPQGVVVHMPMSEPKYYKNYRSRLAVPIQYDSDVWALRGPVALFKEAPRLADPTVADLAREQCEMEYQQVFAGRETLSQRVADYLRMSEEGAALPTLDLMAGWLHLSSRTLKRRLQEESVNYRDMVEAELTERSLRWLADDRLGVSEIAYRLGYNDVSNFSRAFKRWTGKTPREYRLSEL
ncbi:MAG: AraC family transcriptional regulator ligand-binding domain-containing protein [Gammaproteobacteria bacterium]|nr:AraC family transcriptional regulator ligand-binding domain-containing protein [Gammaproteobacteria bacterium]MBQ0773963.1 AraC family transcriptional regulator ligand-binding domain-containing protein [Gammaproteobacteria bacterium]